MIDWLRANWIDMEIVLMLVALISAAIMFLLYFIVQIKEKRRKK